MNYEKYFQVIRYGDDEILIEGTRSECAKHLGISEKKFKGIFDGCHNSNGKSRGYTIVCIGDNKEELEAYHKDLLYRFYDEYWRSPSEREFKEIGGNTGYIDRHCGGWGGFLSLYDFPKTRGDSIEVYEDGELIFIGCPVEVAEEFGFCKTYLTALAKKNSKIGKYTVKIRPFIGLREKGGGLC